jgi:hypothetical protein
MGEKEERYPLMSRKRRVEIETWHHFKYTQEKAVIKLDPETGEFRSEYGELAFASKDLEELRKQLQDAVSTAMELNWIPVLQASVQSMSSATRDKPLSRGHTETIKETRGSRSEECDANINLNFRRFWLSRTPSGQWMRCDVWYSLDDGTDTYNPGHRKLGDPLPRRLNSREWRFGDIDMKAFSLPYHHQQF